MTTPSPPPRADVSLDAGDESTRPIPFLKTRVALAALIATFAAGVPIAGYLDDDLQTCSTTTSQTVENARAREGQDVGDERPSSTEYTQECDPAPLTASLPLFLLAGLLVFDQLSELGVPGLITLKRRVAATAERQGQLEQRLADITTSIATNVTFMIGPTLEQLPAKLQAFSASTGIELPALPPAPASEGAPATQVTTGDELGPVGDLLLAANRVRAYVERADQVTGRGAHIMRAWRDRFKRDISVVLQSALAVQESPEDLGPVEVRQASELAQTVLQILEQALEAVSAK